MLLSNHLLHDSDFDEVNKNHDNVWEWHDSDFNPTKLVSLPDLKENSQDDLTLTSEGLEATYSPLSVYESPGGALPISVMIPNRELRPLVRPGTPLARMLAARGMW